MKRAPGDRKTLDRLLALYSSPSAERMETAIRRVEGRLRSEGQYTPAESLVTSSAIPPHWTFRTVSWATAALVALVVSGMFVRVALVRDPATPGNVEAIDGTLYRLS